MKQLVISGAARNHITTRGQSWTWSARAVGTWRLATASGACAPGGHGGLKMKLHQTICLYRKKRQLAEEIKTCDVQPQLQWVRLLNQKFGLGSVNTLQGVSMSRVKKCKTVLWFGAPQAKYWGMNLTDLYTEANYCLQKWASNLPKELQCRLLRNHGFSIVFTVYANLLEQKISPTSIAHCHFCQTFKQTL